MIKYTDAKVVMAEVPDEITLAINISNCPCQCKGCHSSYLAEDIGKPLVGMVLREMIEEQSGITCVAFMGGDSSPESVNNLAEYLKTWHDGKIDKLKIAWYSGRQELSPKIDLKNFDYIKLGPYIEELGPLDSKTTNQRFYKVDKLSPEETPTGVEDWVLLDETHKFWKSRGCN